MNDPKRYDTGEDATDTHSWAFDTEYDRARNLRFSLVVGDHGHQEPCTICNDAYAMTDRELLTKYQKVTK